MGGDRRGRQEPHHGGLKGHGYLGQAAGNSKAVAEGFNEGIICKAVAELKGQRVGAFSRESYRLSGQGLWPLVKGWVDGTAPNP